MKAALHANRLAAVMAAAALASFSLVAAPGLPGESAAVATPLSDCAVLDPGENCEFTYADHSDGASIMISPSVPVITVLVTGGSGAPGEGHGSGAGGAGALVVAELVSDFTLPLMMTLGAAATDRHGATGWSSGGAGGDPAGTNSDGGGGGGSTMITWGDGPNAGALIVAGGGGGGGGCVVSGDFNETCNGGGDGGSGGDPAQDGSNGYGVDSESNGDGGGAADAGGRDGASGVNWPDDVFALTGGGGGGGGWLNSGGGAGAPGGPSCGGTWTPQCHAEMLGAGGGGGGGGSMSGAPTSWSMTGAPGHGSVVVVAGQPTEYQCADTHDPRLHSIPDGVEQYAAIAVGGSGSRGHNGSGTEGRGGAVSAILDVTGLTELAYWVGCSPYTNSASGYGTGGHGGDAPDFDDMDGGDGGAASMIAIPEGGGRYLPLIAAGGGGGSGGDVGCIGSCTRGGLGGNGGGVAGTANSDHGTDGAKGAFALFPGRGGCGSCVHGAHGGSGTSSGHDSGAGGGGGAGYPYSGHGGGASTDAAGGGGGAGASYAAPHRVSQASIGTNDATGEGFILLVPLRLPTTSLTVQKDVTGAASSYGVGPFGMQVTCTLGGDTISNTVVQVTPTTPHTVDGIPVGAECTVTEVHTGGASTSAPPHSVVLTAAPATVIMTNDFAASSFSVTVASTVVGEGNTPDPGISFNLGDVLFLVTCRVDGTAIRLPGEAHVGLLRFDGNDTLAAGGVTKTVSGVPSGAACVAAVVSGATHAQVMVNGASQSPSSIEFTTGPQPTVVEVGEEFWLAPLEVSKVLAGSGIAPPGHEYGFSISCTFERAPVTLPSGGDTILVPGDATVGFHNLPVGSVCGVVETDTGGATAVQFSPSSHVTIGESGSAMQVTNTFSTDPLTVTLTNSGPGASWANAATQVEVSCTVGGSPLPTVVLDFPPEGGTQSITADDGATCEVSSVSAAGQLSTQFASTSDPAWSGTPVSVTVAAGAGLRVDNVFGVAPIEVTSVNSGAGADFANAPTAATVTCTFNGLSAGPDAVLPFGIHGGVPRVPAMVAGAVCSVVQSQTGGATTVAWTVENSGGPDGSGATVTVTEPSSSVTIDNVFDLAGLTVTKTVAGAAAWASNTDFLVDVTCTFNGLPITSIGPSGVAPLSFGPDGTPVSSHGFNAIAALPVGASCTAVETADGGATEVSYVPGASVDVELGSGIEVINRFDASSLTISATVSGNDADSHALDSFTFAQSCTFNGILLGVPQTTPAWTGAPVIVAGGSVTFAELPVGAVCGVSEVGSNHATAVNPAADQEVTLAATPAVVAFDNVFDVGSMTLTQILDGAGAATYGLGQTFVIDMFCGYGDGTGARVPLPQDGLFPFSATTGWSTAFDVPVDATCSVVQPGRFMATSVAVSSPVVVQPGDNTMTVTSTFDLDEIEVTTSAVGLKNPATEFGYAAGCTWQQSTPIPLNDPVDSIFDLRSGQTMVLEALVGAQCSVAQVDDAGAIRVVVTATGAGATTSGVTASAFLREDIPADFAFVNYMPGSIPVTGTEWRFLGALAVALLLAGATMLLVRTAWRSRAR